MTIVTCVVAILGCILDITDRKDIPLNQNILTLQTFDKETNLKNIQTTNILKVLLLNLLLILKKTTKVISCIVKIIVLNQLTKQTLSLNVI